MKRFSIQLIDPLNVGVLTIVYIFAGLCFGIIGFKFFSNAKTGLTLLYLGAQPRMIFKMIPGIVKRSEADKMYNVYGYAYISPSKCIAYGVLFSLAALIIILLNFVYIRDLG